MTQLYYAIGNSRTLNLFNCLILSIFVAFSCHIDAHGSRAVKQVNLLNHPLSSEINSYEPNDELTFGDLHGNTIKLIYFLIHEGIIELRSIKDPTKSKDKLFSELVEIYQSFNDVPDPSLLAKFEEIIDETEIKSRPSLRFIGDELADRGSNDLLTLLVFKKLQGRVPFEILLSNHGMEFIRVFENEILGKDTSIYPIVGAEATPSVQQLIRWIHMGSNLNPENLERKAKVISLVKEAYLPNLKLLSYSRSAVSHSSENSIAIYSHAPVGIDILTHLANSRWAQNYGPSPSAFCTRAVRDLDQLGLFHCIDWLNHNFIGLRDNHQISKAYEKEIRLFESVDNRKAMKFLIWNRSYRNLVRPAHITFVNGHDSKDPSDPLIGGSLRFPDPISNVVNLDNHLGKGDTNWSGEYAVFHTRKDILPVTQQSRANSAAKSTAPRRNSIRELPPKILANPSGNLDAAQGLRHIQALIARGVDVNKIRPVDGATMLFMATREGFLDAVQALIAAGADVNKGRARDGAAPIHFAAQNGYTEVVQALIGARADVNRIESSNGFTPLCSAAREGHEKIVQALIAAGADVNTGITRRGD